MLSFASCSVEKKWRTSGRIAVSTTVCTFKARKRDDNEFSLQFSACCTCIPYKNKKRCDHVSAAFGKPDVALKARAIMSRITVKSSNEDDRNQWRGLEIPAAANDDVSV